MLKQFHLLAYLCTGFLLLALSAVPAIAGVVIITETEHNITAEYTGSPSTAAPLPKSSEPPPERPPKPEPVARKDKPTATTDNAGKPVDRRIQRQQRQRPFRGANDDQ